MPVETPAADSYREDLVSSGNSVESANLPAFGSVETRANQLAEVIEAVLADTGA